RAAPVSATRAHSLERTERCRLHREVTTGPYGEASFSCDLSRPVATRLDLSGPVSGQQGAPRDRNPGPHEQFRGGAEPSDAGRRPAVDDGARTGCVGD